MNALNSKPKALKKAAEPAVAEAPRPVPPADPEAATPAPTPAPAKPRRKGRRALMLSLPLALAIGGALLWITGGRYVSTDNAYVHQPMIPISADVSGRVTQVNVAENQPVTGGTPLFRIDPVPYRINADRAEASLAAARLAVFQQRAQYQTAHAELEAAESLLEIQNRELERQKELTTRGVGTAASLDSVTSATLAAKNRVAVAQRQLDAAAAALSGDPDVETDALPSVRAAIANSEAAARDLAHTEVSAPSNGVVSQLENLNVGQFIAAGAEVAMLVDTEHTWIEANFKETQLDGLKIGQPVTITVDAYPGLELAGTIDSFGSATGSQFSLIPAQNATGNWVKVVQRLSVRIRLDAPGTRPLRDGMSVHVTVDTGHSRLDDLR